VKNLKPKLDISAANIKLEFSVDTTIDPATHVKESLLLLESLLEEKQQQAVLLLDEFQNVGVIAQGKGIEGAIRHVAQKTKYLTIIFSGSNRKLLKTMFEDETRPLYKLCWKMELHRIAAEHYSQQIQKAAKFAWQQELDEPIIAKIFLLTERHPYYLNKLCDKLWTYYGQQVPSIKQVEKAWDDILAEEKSDAIKEISLLSLNQKAVLLQLAKKTTPQLTSKEVVLKLAIPSSSIISALEKLEEKDVIERKEEGDEEEAAYRIINPVIKYYVLKDTVIVH
jgi:DNA-binding IclR family transcriptional regulator